MSMKSLSTRYFFTSRAIFTACHVTMWHFRCGTKSLSYKGPDLGLYDPCARACRCKMKELEPCLSLHCSRCTLHKKIIHFCEIIYLHLWYLGDCEHAADEEARENVIVHQILSHPDLHLSVQDSRSDELRKTSIRSCAGV